MAHSHLDPESDAYRSTLSPDLDERRHGALLSMLAAVGISDPPEPEKFYRYDGPMLGLSRVEIAAAGEQMDLPTMVICDGCRRSCPVDVMDGDLCVACSNMTEAEWAYEAAIERAERDRDER